MARSVTLRNPRTGEVRNVRAGAVPFFTNQGFEPVTGPAQQPSAESALAELQTAAESAAREAADLAHAVDAVTAAVAEDPADPGASTTPTPSTDLSKEN